MAASDDRGSDLMAGAGRRSAHQLSPKECWVQNSCARFKPKPGSKLLDFFFKLNAFGSRVIIGRLPLDKGGPQEC